MVEIRVVDCKKFRKAILHHHMCRILRKNMSFLRQFASFANLCVVFVEFYDLTSTILETYILPATYVTHICMCKRERNLFRFIKSKYFTPIQLYDQIKLIYIFYFALCFLSFLSIFFYFLYQTNDLVWLAPYTYTYTYLYT